MSQETPRLLTLEEILDHLRISRRTLFRLKDQGLPYIKVGRSLRFDLLDVDRWVRQQGQIAPGAEGGE